MKKQRPVNNLNGVTKNAKRVLIGASGTTIDITEREKQLLSVAAKGYTTQQIARHLNISPATVETHRNNILRKLNTGNMTEAVVLALKSGWID